MARETGHTEYNDDTTNKDETALRLAMGGGTTASASAKQSGGEAWEEYINKVMPDRDVSIQAGRK